MINQARNFIKKSGRAAGRAAKRAAFKAASKAARLIVRPEQLRRGLRETEQAFHLIGRLTQAHRRQFLALTQAQREDWLRHQVLGRLIPHLKERYLGVMGSLWCVTLEDWVRERGWGDIQGAIGDLVITLFRRFMAHIMARGPRDDLARALLLEQFPAHIVALMRIPG